MRWTVVALAAGVTVGMATNALAYVDNYTLQVSYCFGMVLRGQQIDLTTDYCNGSFGNSLCETQKESRAYTSSLIQRMREYLLVQVPVSDLDSSVALLLAQRHGYSDEMSSEAEIASLPTSTLFSCIRKCSPLAIEAQAACNTECEPDPTGASHRLIKCPQVIKGLPF